MDQDGYLLIVGPVSDVARLLPHVLALDGGHAPALRHVATVVEARRIVEERPGCRAAFVDLTLVRAGAMGDIQPGLAQADPVPVVVLADARDEGLAGAAVLGGAQDYLVRERLGSEKLRRALGAARRWREASGAGRIDLKSGRDRVTGLPDADRLLDQANQACSAAQRHGRYGALLIVQLEECAAIAADLGEHAAGRRLVAIAQTLERCVRCSDTVAWMGANRYGILLSEIAKPDDGALVADNLAIVLTDPLATAERSPPVAACIGVARFPADACDATGLVDHALQSIARQRASRMSSLPSAAR